MRKSVFTRIVWFLFLYLAVFILLVVMQFSQKGNFSYKFGEMTIRGRYLDETMKNADELTSKEVIASDVTIFFGGLEFLIEYNSDTNEPDPKFFLINEENIKQHVFPEYITVLDNGAIITLSEGTEVSFINRDVSTTNELQISASFKENISAVNIPFALQSSLLIREDKNLLNISYNGIQYQFNRQLQGMDEGQLILNTSMPTISYRAILDKRENSPEDFILAQAENAETFNELLEQWIENNFKTWEKNMQLNDEEDSVIAWCAEALRKGNYRSAVSVIPLSFSPSPERTWESGVFQFDRRIGVWEKAVRAVTVHDREKLFRINQMLEEKNPNVFIERNLIEFLVTRDHTQLVNNCISLIQTIDLQSLTPEIFCGILDAYFDSAKWQVFEEINPFTSLAEQAAGFFVEKIQQVDDYVFFIFDDKADLMLNIRLGASLRNWGTQTGKENWAALGRSIIFSIISLCDENGTIPSVLQLDENGNINRDSNRINSAKLYRIFIDNEFLPHAAVTGINGLWAWTASTLLSVSQNERQMDIEIKFPVGETHYIMLRNIKPFYILQIYGSDWRRAYDFENYYDSSGWYYFESDQTLVIKLRHRTETERVRIITTAPPRPPPPPPPPPEQNQETVG